MSTLRALSLDDALKLAAAFFSAPSRPIGDKALPDGRIEANCFYGNQLADFLRCDEAGAMKASRTRSPTPRSLCIPAVYLAAHTRFTASILSRVGLRFSFDTRC